MSCFLFFYFFFNDAAPTEIYTLSLHDALPICDADSSGPQGSDRIGKDAVTGRKDDLLEPFLDLLLGEDLQRSEEHTSELQSQFHLVCRLLLEKKKYKHILLPSPNINARS